MGQGGYEKKIRAQAEKFSMELPDKIKNKPKVPESLAFTWRAFWELSTDRTIGMVEGPLPWSSIDRYAKRYGITDLDDFDYFSILLKQMDATYMEFRGKKSGKTNMNVGGEEKVFTPPTDKDAIGMK